jgi:cytochrome P450
LIGDLSFGENFGCLDSGDYDPFVRSIKAISKELTFIQMWKYYGLTRLGRFFTPRDVAGTRARNMKRVVDAVERRVRHNTGRKDFLYYILAANDEKGMTRAEIDVNSFSLNIAGSESTATLLAGATYYILKHPRVYEKLINEIRTAYKSADEITLTSVNDLEYLDSVLSEALRLYPPVAGTLPRVVPPGGESINGAYIPAGTTVGVNHYSCFRHPENFYRHNDFLPERWLPEHRSAAPFDQDNRLCMQPFSYGPRNCLGKNLARAEMRLIMAKLVWTYDIELDRRSENWQEGQKVYGFWVKPPLICWLSLVKRG